MKIVVVLSRIPFPLEKGDKLRAYHQIKELAKSNEIYLICTSDKPIENKAKEELLKFCKEVHFFKLNKIKTFLNLGLGFFSNKPFQVKYFYQKSIHKKVKILISKVKPNHIYCQLIRSAEYVKKEHNYPKTIDFMDALSKGMERRIESSPWYLKPFVKAEAKRLLAYENLVFDYFDNHTIISEQDRELIYHENRKDIKVIANGVDTDFFAPKSINKKFDLVFVGNLNYPPNIAASEFLANEILPILKQTKKDIKILISGATPNQRVLALKNENITIKGWVEDIRTSYLSAQVFIAPMTIGTGLQNKLLEAMSMEIPCITTNLANNALKAEHNNSILVADNPNEISNSILELLNNHEKAKNIAKNGRDFVKSNYVWKSTTNQLQKIFN